MSQYGVIGYQWTTYTSAYDMGVRTTCPHGQPVIVNKSSSLAMCCQRSADKLTAQRSNFSEYNHRLKGGVAMTGKDKFSSLRWKEEFFSVY